MSDLIDRQAAIDALGDMVMNWTDSDYELGQLNQWKEDRKAIIDLPSAQPQRWIPVTERLPEEGQNCLVCIDGVIGIDIYLGHGGAYDWECRVSHYDAWMPLPEPYKGE